MVRNSKRHTKTGGSICGPAAMLFLCMSLLICQSCGEKEELESLEQKPMPKVKRNLTITLKGYCPTEGQAFVDFYAANLSARIKDNKLLTDFDRDGVPNLLDSNPEININYKLEDTNFDGYSDLLMYLSGVRLANQQNLKPCESKDQDTDQDGLSDCEEDNILHTDYNMIDTDGDGITDYLEIRNGMNPLDGDDAFQDLDDDGFSNADEVRKNTPINETNTDQINLLAYHYDVSKNLDDPVAQCYDFTVSNIPMVSVANGNLVQFYIMERDTNTKMILRNFKVVVPRQVADGAELIFPIDEIEEGI